MTVLARIFTLVFFLSCATAWAQRPGSASLGKQASHTRFVTSDLRIPMKDAGPLGLQALLVRPDEPGPHPLVVVTHGTNYSADVRRARSPRSQLPIAMEFARRGWTAVIVMRRSNGSSGGTFQEALGICEKQRYETIGQAAADDLRAAIDFLATRPDVDPRRIIAIGVSGGGFATVALTVNPPRGLVAAINFAGGMWVFRSHPACNDNLVAAFRSFGSKSRIPMLWVYSENDLVFWPEIARRFYAAFTDAGGNARFVQAPPFEDNGHNLLGSRGIPIWTDYVDRFLKSQKLPLRTVLLPLPPPEPSHPVRPPRELAESEIPYFQEYLGVKGQKAFAVSASGDARYAFGFSAADQASKAALELCQAHGEKCRVVFVNNSAVKD